ncbi:hypothetical protein ESCO_004518 [Escovopsis weberi]|uniref:Pentatricopeptide repeat domain-containing protein n=1 Tax=Escovopsis weberi TaxID=150374 RepID=A0A0M8MWQ1_ESCWE|nr:hypothetical protein ESCO_004518 [Escovopsis weberi]
MPRPQRRDIASIHKAFIAWTDLLIESTREDGFELPSPERAALAREQVQSLPGPTLSEILRSIDPLNSPYDIANGLFFSQGQTQFFDLSNLIDPFGVRRLHRKIMLGMESLMRIRAGSRLGLLPHDYQVFMRCAGAAMDYERAKTFWAAMASHGLSRARTGASWTDFIKARFVTEPLYYQFDRSRMAVMARDLYRSRSVIPMAVVKRLERLRLSVDAFRRQPWNRRPDQPDEDVRRLFRRRGDYKAFKNHWIRAAYYGHEMDEDLLCVSMIAFARSSSLASIRSLILLQYFGVTITNVFDPSQTTISGGHDLPPGSLIRPTAKFLDALVESFGSMSHIALGSRLLEFFSRKYDIPIPHATWSNLLNWAYVCASKPFRPMRRIHGSYPSTAVSSHDVRQIWTIMTSAPYNVEPTFDDLNCFIKTLILQHHFMAAVTMIKESAIPMYNALAREFEAALLDEVLQLDAVATKSNAHPHYNAPGNQAIQRAIHRRERAQLLKDRAHQQITSLFVRILKMAGRRHTHRSGSFPNKVIPRLIRQHPDFFPSQVRFRTSQGEVVLHRPGVVERFKWVPTFRTVRAQRRAGWTVMGIEGSDHKDFAWPTTPALRLREWVRRPVKRKPLGPPPLLTEDRRWWEKLEQHLML